jgi:hypothetical protein
MRRRVAVSDAAEGYVYFFTVPAGRNFAERFTPELTPKQMLRLGVLEGNSCT